MEIDIIVIGLILIIIVFVVRNIVLLRDLAISKKYNKIYKAVVNKDPDIINKIEEYLKTEKNEYLITKTNVLLMYQKLLNGEDVSNIVSRLDYTKIFLRKGKYEKDFVNLNSDMFIWAICCLPRLRKGDILPLIKDKVSVLEDKLSKHIEYKVFFAACAVLERNTEESKFLDKLVNGEYSGLEYDKHLIAVTKRIALAYIASLNKEKNIEYADELKILSESMLGRNLLTDLEIYEVYK